MTRHAFDAVSFAFGALFLIAGVMLLSGKPNTDALEWVGPGGCHWPGGAHPGRHGATPTRGYADEAADDEPMGDASEA